MIHKIRKFLFGAEGSPVQNENSGVRVGDEFLDLGTDNVFPSENVDYSAHSGFPYVSIATMAENFTDEPLRRPPSMDGSTGGEPTSTARSVSTSSLASNASEDDALSHYGGMPDGGGAAGGVSDGNKVQMLDPRSAAGQRREQVAAARNKARDGIVDNAVGNTAENDGGLLAGRREGTVQAAEAGGIAFVGAQEQADALSNFSKDRLASIAGHYKSFRVRKWGHSLIKAKSDPHGNFSVNSLKFHAASQLIHGYIAHIGAKDKNTLSKLQSGEQRLSITMSSNYIMSSGKEKSFIKKALDECMVLGIRPPKFIRKESNAEMSCMDIGRDNSVMMFLMDKAMNDPALKNRSLHDACSFFNNDHDSKRELAKEYLKNLLVTNSPADIATMLHAADMHRGFYSHCAATEKVLQAYKAHSEHQDKLINKIIENIDKVIAARIAPKVTPGATDADVDVEHGVAP